MRSVVEWVVEPRRKRERSDGVSETMQHGDCLRIRESDRKNISGKMAGVVCRDFGVVCYRSVSESIGKESIGFVTILSTTNFENPRQGSAPKYSL